MYDPLVDWTTDKVEGESRHHADLHITISLCSSRLEEAKASMLESKAKLVLSLQGLLPHLRTIVESYSTCIFFFFCSL